MTNLKSLTDQNAPEAAREALAQAKKNYGFIPNLLGNMANAPALLKAYLAVGALFDQTSLSPTERQVVLLTVSAQNGCGYCVAAHTAIAGMQKVPQDVVNAIRHGEPIADPKLESLRAYTKDVVERRGWPSADAAARFEAAGYTSEQALEVVLGVGMKTLSNYTNHIAETPLDPQFTQAAWEPAGATKG
jgi:uncharacterized peroxidase-related enzyme